MSFGRFIKDKKKYGLAFVLSALVAVGLFFVASPLLAQQQNLDTLRTSAGFGNVDLIVLIGRIIQVILGLLGVVAVILLIYAGFYWMTAGGDPNKVIKAKKIITGTIIGLVIVFMSFAIVSFILSRFGGDAGGPGAPCTEEGKTEPCLTSDICEGERACYGGYWGGCVKTDLTCPIDPFYGKQFTYISGFSDPQFSGWTRLRNLSRGFSGILQLPLSGSLVAYGYAHDRESQLSKLELHPEDAAAIDFGALAQEIRAINGQPYNVVAEASTTWDTSSYTNNATTSIFIKAFDSAAETFDSKSLKARFWPAHCFNNIQDADESDIDCGGSCPNCDGASCRRPDNNVCSDDNCGSGICLMSSCTCATSPRIDYISPATDTLGNTDFDIPSTTLDDIANGAPGSFITIWGRHFGTAPGRVIFRDVYGRQYQTPIYLSPNCTGTWSNNQIITKVPDNLDSVSVPNNLLANSGFENDFSANSWYLASKGSGVFELASGADYLSITSTAEGISPHGDDRMLRFDYSDPSKYLNIRYQNPITLTEGKKYVFSAYVYVVNVENLPRVFLDLWDNGRHAPPIGTKTNMIDVCQANPTNVGCDNSNTPTATGTWQRIAVDFTVLPGGSLEFYPRIVIANGGSAGKVYVDDLQLEEIPSNASNPTEYAPQEFLLGNYQVEVVNTSTNLTSNQKPFEVNDIERPGICTMIPGNGVHPSTTQIYGNKLPTAGTQEVWWQVYNRYYQVESGVGISSTAVKEEIKSIYATGWTQFSATDTPPANKRGHAGVRVYNGTEYSNYFNFLISAGGLGDVCGYSNLACNEDNNTCISGLGCQYCQSADPTAADYEADCDYSKNCTCQPTGAPVCTPGVVSTTPAGDKVTCTPPFAGANCTGFSTCNPAGNGYVCVADPTDTDCPDYLVKDNAAQSIFSYAFTAVRSGGEGASCGYDAWGACDINGCDKGFVCDVEGSQEDRGFVELYNPTDQPINMILCADDDCDVPVNVGSENYYVKDLPIKRGGYSLFSIEQKTLYSSPQHFWKSVTYGADKFVAVSFVSGAKKLMTSEDGINWTDRSAATDNQWRAVTYGAGKFVAVAFNGTNRVMTSEDGINWTARSAAEDNQWTSVTYGAGKFVAVANSGTNKVMTSEDGINWTARSVPGNNQWTSVTYGAGKFVAVSFTGVSRVMTSEDGINWTAKTTPENNSWQSVTYGGDKFVAVADSGTNRMMTSEDGINWTAKTTPENNSWQSVTYGAGKFVAVASDGTNRVMNYQFDTFILTSTTSAYYPNSYGRTIDGDRGDLVFFPSATPGVSNGNGTGVNPEGRVVINELSFNRAPCTCVAGQTCKPGQKDTKTCPNLGACAQVNICNAGGYWGGCALADPNCIAYPFYGNAAQSIFAWAFVANLANATDEPYVVESCSRTDECVGQPLGSPSPWYEGDTYQENGKNVGWTSTTNPYVINPKACLDSVITARFNVKMFEDSFVDRVVMLKCDNRECTQNPVQIASIHPSIDSDNNSLEDDILNLNSDGDLVPDKWYKVILLKGIVSDFNKPLRVDADKITERHCAVSGKFDEDDIAYCWNFQTRKTVTITHYDLNPGSNLITLPNIPNDSKVDDIIGGQLIGSMENTSDGSDWITVGGKTLWFNGIVNKWFDGPSPTTITLSPNEQIEVKIRITPFKTGLDIFTAYTDDGPLYCNIGCVECQPNPSTAWWYQYQTQHRASPVADDNVCIALDGSKYGWDWTEKEYDGDPSSPSELEAADDANWLAPSANPYATVMDSGISTSTSTALQETIFNNPKFVRISATERESKKTGYCKLKIDFTNPRVMEDPSCTEGTTQSPSPYKGTTDACINAMISARFSRNMRNASIFGNTNSNTYIGTTSTTIIIQRCDSETDVTSTALNAAGNCDNIPFNAGFIFPYSYPDLTLEQMAAASTTVTSSDPEGFVINPNDGDATGQTLKKDTWYRVIVRGGENGVRGATGTNETAYGALVTPGLTYDFNFFSPSETLGDGEADYMWYFKTANTDQSCPIDTVNVSPFLKFFRYVDQNSLYNATPQAANCNILDGDAYTWAWRSLLELSDDTVENSAGSGYDIARICPTSSTAYLSCATSTNHMVRVFGVSEGLVNIKARASSTRKFGSAWNDPANGDKWGSGQLQIGYGNLAVTGYAPQSTVCQNPDYMVRFNTDVDVSTFSLNTNVKLYRCYEGDAYYPLNGTSTNASGISTLYGNFSNPRYVSGKFGQAAAFDAATNAFIEVPAAIGSVLKPSGALTVSAWVKLDSSPTGSQNGRVIASTYKWANSTNCSACSGWLLGKEFDQGGNIVFKIIGNDSKARVAGYVNFFNDYGKKFVHVAGVFKPRVGTEGGYVKLFIDGRQVSVTSTDVTGINYDSATNLVIGKRADYSTNGEAGMWDGAIDEVRIYDRALSANEIRKLSESEADSCPFILAPIDLRYFTNLTSIFARQFFMTSSALTAGRNYRVAVKGGASGVMAWNNKPLSGLNYKVSSTPPAGEECEINTYPWNTTLVNSQNICSSSLGCVLDPNIDLCGTIYSQCATSTIGTDYCSPTCHNLGNRELASCGDGILALQEECDDGNTKSDDGCDNHCMLEGASDRWGSLCGNDIVETGEQCDDGGATLAYSGPHCNEDCFVASGTQMFRKAGSDPNTPICGNGIVEKGESCDDGNIESEDGCLGTDGQSGCIFEGSKNGAVCGNDVVETGQYDSFSWAFTAGDRVCNQPNPIISPCINGIWRFEVDQDTVLATTTIYKKMEAGARTDCDQLALKSKPANFFVAALNKIKDVVLKFLGVRKASASIMWCPISTKVFGSSDFLEIKKGFYNGTTNLALDGINYSTTQLIGYTNENDLAVINYINTSDWIPGAEYRAKVVVQDANGIVRSAEKTEKMFANACRLKGVIAEIWPRGQSKNQDTFFCAGNDCGKNTSDGDFQTHSEEYDDDMSAVWTKYNSYYDLPSTATDYLSENQHIYRLWAIGVNGYLLRSSFVTDSVDLDGAGISRSDLQVGGNTTAYTGDYWITGGDKNGEAVLLVTSTGASAGTGVVTSTVLIRTFLCQNPWPNWQDFPFEDSTNTNCSVGTGTCFRTNFLTYYCRDAGDAGTTTDDLPALPQTAAAGVVIREGASAFDSCANLPYNFVPRLGYYNHFEGRVNIWNNQGEAYSYDNALSWEKVAMGVEAAHGLPNNFRPVIGYHHDYGGGGGRINLWDASGRLYVGKNEVCGTGNCVKWYAGNDSRHGTVNSGLPKGFVPSVGYYANALYLWSGRNLYKGIGSGGLINYAPVSYSNLPDNYYPIIGYYDSQFSRQVVWNSAGIRYVSGDPNGTTWIRVNPNPSSLPSNFRPKVGYYDRLLNKEVLWDGQLVYSSLNGSSFSPEYYFNNNCDINIKEFFFNTTTAAGGNIGLGIKVVSNGNHYSPLYWYQTKFAKDRQGNPKAVETNGYQGILEGRTAYFNAVNYLYPDNYTNIYIMSYDQDNGTEAGNIFSQMVDNWQFNTAQSTNDYVGVCTDFISPINPDYHCGTDESCLRFSTSTKYFCNSNRAETARDARRLSDIQDINVLLVNYYNKSRCSNDFLRLCTDSNQCYGGGFCGKFYPNLKSGTYLIGKSYSVWPSWLSNLGNSLGTALPMDPVNKFIGCAPNSSGATNSITCWNEQNKTMSCPADGLIYQYVDLQTAMTRLSIKSEFFTDISDTNSHWKPAWGNVNFLRANPFAYYATSTFCQNLPACGNGTCNIEFGENSTNCIDCNQQPIDIEPLSEQCGNGTQQTDFDEACDGGNFCRSDCQCVDGAVDEPGTNSCYCGTGYRPEGNVCVCKPGWTCPPDGGPGVCNEGNDCDNLICENDAYGTFPNCHPCPDSGICDGGEDFECHAPNFIRRDTPPGCVCQTPPYTCSDDDPEVLNCEPGYYLNGGYCITCPVTPVTASCSGGTESFTCPSCYRPNTAGNACECNPSFYQSGGVCRVCPANAVCNCTGFTCNAGYYQSGSTCLRCPDHATCSATGFTCNSGYKPNGTDCQACDLGDTCSCPSGQTWAGTTCCTLNSTTCSSCPAQNYWSESSCVSCAGNSWTCSYPADWIDYELSDTTCTQQEYHTEICTFSGTPTCQTLFYPKPTEQTEYRWISNNSNLDGKCCRGDENGITLNENYANESACKVVAGDKITLKVGKEFVHKSGSKIITADDGTSKIAIYVEAISSILYTLKYVDSGSYYLAHEDNQMQLFTSFPEKFTGYYFSSANIYKGGTYNIQFYWNANNPYYKYVDPNVGGTNAVIKEGDTGTGFTVCDQAGNCSF